MKKNKILLQSEEVEVEIIRSSRRTVALHVREGGAVVVRAPRLLPVFVIMQFVQSKAQWIARHRERLRSVQPQSEKVTVCDGDQVPFMGMQLTARIIAGKKKSVIVRSVSQEIILSGNPSPTEAWLMLDRWYLAEAGRYLPARTFELAGIHSDLLPSPAAVNVRKMKRKWGTCRTNGVIWLNRELIKKEAALSDYVIIHELCHLVHHNHGSGYYDLLGRIIPSYKSLRAMLRR